MDGPSFWNDDRRTNTCGELISKWRQIFSAVNWLKIAPNELEGLSLQATASPPPQLNRAMFYQLVSLAMLSCGAVEPSATFVGQILTNKIRRVNPRGRTTALS
ncbi:hypothetical protein O181_007972 [Austropuccinia psidii MF-1]|uniref:Uncharacterized protein n=1 Tax=Austropuccinia psidii MF-1 TaxID=1389203 RepID=A0A9Q3BNU7_9BASI|nr:hypothetical protein [Austropuccinia psidii MF-1]